MPCRPRLCQQLAAQLSHPPPATFGSNHIWISDDILSEAFNRYVRVSHASRRYGSNVPGPLEARRRASKRRMGCAVAATSMGPPGGDFGALFGSGSGGGNAVESGWTWKAPGTQPAPTTTTSNGWNWGAKPAEPPAEWEQLLEIPRSGEELVEESREAFEELLQNVEDIEVLQASDVAALTEFLASSADEPEAKNVSRLIQWLSGRDVGDPAWHAITALICDKIQLASIDNEVLLEVIRALPGVLQREQDESARQQLHKTYAAFAESLEDWGPSGDSVFQPMFEEVQKTTQDAQGCSTLIAILTKTTGDVDAQVISKNIALTLLAIQNCGAEDLVRTQLLSQLQTLLHGIHSTAIAEALRLATIAIFDNGASEQRHKDLQALAWLDCVEPASFPVDHMPIVYAEIAKHISFHQIIDRIAQRHIDPSDIVRFLLRTWFPNSGVDHKLGSWLKSGNAAFNLYCFKRIQYATRGFATTDFPAVEAEFENLYHESGSCNAWPNLVKAYRRQGLPYRHVVDLVLGICKVLHEPKTIYDIFFNMLKDHELAIPTDIYISIIEYFLANGENDLAFKVFCQSLTIAIIDVPDLPKALLADDSVQFDICEMLNRNPRPVAMEARDSYKLNFTPGHVELVHILAHDCANQESLRPSQAYRNVWVLYRWLQDRGAPLQPLMSRAMVTAGILRHIKALKWIPDERLEYILSIVEKVEGVEIREEVEQLATYMRSSVHDKVLAKRRAEAESAWMNRSDGLLDRAKFRLKKWTKRKPVPVVIEKKLSFVVPGRRDYKWRRLPIATGSSAPKGDLVEVNDAFSTPASADRQSAGTKLSAATGDLVEVDDAFTTSASAECRPAREERKPEIELWDSARFVAESPIEKSSNQQDVLAGQAAEPVSWQPPQAVLETTSPSPVAKPPTEKASEHEACSDQRPTDEYQAINHISPERTEK